MASTDSGSVSDGGATASVDVMSCRWAAASVSPGSNGALTRREQGWAWAVLRRRELARMNARHILSGVDSDEARLDSARWESPAAMARSYGYPEDDALAASPVTSAAAFSIARSLGLPPSSCVRMVRSPAEQALLAWGPRTLEGQVPAPPRSRSPPRRTARPYPPPPPPPPLPLRPSQQVLLARVSHLAEEVERFADRPEVTTDVVLLQKIVALTQRIVDVGRVVVQATPASAQCPPSAPQR